MRGTRGIVALVVANLTLAGVVVAARAGDSGPEREVVVGAADDLDTQATTTTATAEAPTTTAAAPTSTTVAAPVTTGAPRRAAPAPAPAPTTPPAPPPDSDLAQDALWVIGPDGAGLRKVGPLPDDWRAHWLPDSRSLAFVHQSDVVVLDTQTGAMRVLIDGERGTPTSVWRVTGVSGDGAWISYRHDSGGPHFLVSPDGTRRHEVPPDLTEPGHWSPDGRFLAFVTGSGMKVYEPATGTTRDVLPQYTSPVYGWTADSREIIYQFKGVEIIGVDGKGHRPLMGGPVSQIVASPSGLLGYHTMGTTIDTFAIHTIRPDGSENVKRVHSAWTGPEWAPSGDRFAYLGYDGARENEKDLGLYVTSDLGATRRTLADDKPGMELLRPAWSPDGTLIAFATRRIVHF